MKIRNFISVLFGMGGLLFLVSDASAQLAMQERENVQTIVRVVEFTTFITLLAVGLFVWRLSKRESKKRRDRQNKE
ncbi:MAG: hypothetical protein R8K20_04530 [Gallionellaceae bacterium]